MKKAILVLGIGLLSLLTTLVLYEIVLRLFFPPPELIDIRAISSASGVSAGGERKEIRRFFMETEKGRRLRPNLRANISHHHTSGLSVTVETNSLGYRHHEIEPKSAKRVLFLGDSITLSDYLDDSDTFVRQVETLSIGRTEPLEAINAGIGGESLQTYLYVLEETGLSTHPDLVVVGLYLNDFLSSRSIRLFYPPEFLHGSWAANYLFHIFSKKYAKFLGRNEEWEANLQFIPQDKIEKWVERILCCFSELEREGNGVTEFKTHVIDSIQDWGGAWNEEAWTRMEKTLIEMKARLDRDRIPLAIVLFPVSYQVDSVGVFDFPQRQAARIAGKLKVPLLDILPLLRQERQRSQERLFYDQCHHTPYASKLIAQDILSFLIREGLVSSFGGRRSE